MVAGTPGRKTGNKSKPGLRGDTMQALLIRTKYDPKPIPIRSYDWDAWIDGHEEDYGTAHGPTEAVAVEELAETVSERIWTRRDALQRSLEAV